MILVLLLIRSARLVLSSDRFGVDKIFSFVKNPPKLTAKISLSDKISNAPVAGVNVKVITTCNFDTTFTSDESGKFALPLTANCNYTFQFENRD